MSRLKLSEWWPIQRGEGKHFLLVTGMGFFIAVNYFLLRNLKDTLIATHPSLGVECIPFLKLWIVLPSVALLSFVYKKISLRVSQKALFRITVALLVGYLLLFSFFLQETRLTTPLPIPQIVRYWSYSLFYLCAELWSTGVMMILFWGMLNRITPSEQAARFYGPLIFIYNFAAVLSGKISLTIQKSAYFQGSWEKVCQGHLLLVAIVACAVLWFHGRINTVESPENHPEPTAKGKVSWIGGSLVITVFSYYFCHSMMEVLWQAKLHELHPTPLAFNSYLSTVAIWIGLGSSLGSLLVTTPLLQRVPWRVSALITPCLLTCCFTLFFASSNLTGAVFFGALYHCLSRILKFIAFDPSKELTFTTLPREAQIQAKPIVDGIAPQLGKSSESLVLTSSIAAFGQVATALPFLCGLLFMTKLCWCWCCVRISPLSVRTNHTEELAPTRC
jgi:AAA family ATP:ADP antiporter